MTAGLRDLQIQLSPESAESEAAPSKRLSEAGSRVPRGTRLQLIQFNNAKTKERDDTHENKINEDDC